MKVTARQEAGGGTDVPNRPPVPAKPGLSAGDDLAADGAFGWRQYLAQSAGPTTGVVQRAVRQAASRAHTQIVREARYIRQNGNSEVSVRLHPPELGRIKVAIEMRDGKLDVRIRVEDPQVREALKLELAGLDRTLRDAQLDLTRLEVSDYHAGTREGMQDGFSEGDGVTSGEQSPDQLAGDEATNAHAWAVFTESGGVDCLI
jgi:flagellar hook-length control protein FliK